MNVHELAVYLSIYIFTHGAKASPLVQILGMHLTCQAVSKTTKHSKLDSLLKEVEIPVQNIGLFSVGFKEETSHMLDTFVFLTNSEQRSW